MINNLSMWWIYALLSAFFAALTTILAKIGVEGISANLATAIRTVIILLMAWSIVWIEGSYRSLHQIPYRPIFFIILSGITTGFSWLFYFKSLQIGEASLVSPIDKSSVVLVLLMSAIFLGEALTWKAILGTLFVLGGILILIL
ncbi:MAG TPA: EamA family transporter [Oculatellaceae cyanobacterium]|jgi:transporter family protein